MGKPEKILEDYKTLSYQERLKLSRLVKAAQPHVEIRVNGVEVPEDHAMHRLIKEYYIPTLPPETYNLETHS